MMNAIMDLDCKTLWMGDIQINWDEAFISGLFSGTGEQPSVKLIRDRVTGYPAGYGFLEFQSRYAAERVLDTYNGQQIRKLDSRCHALFLKAIDVAGTMQRFRLNWGAGGRRLDQGDEYSIFVGDLAPDVSDALLQNTFAVRFPSVRGAKVVIDQMTGIPKGFGFVRFGTKEDADQALQTMNGVYCSSRPIRVSAATDKKNRLMAAAAGYPTATVIPSEDSDDPANCTVFIGGLDPAISEEELKTRFATLGEVVYVKIPPGRGCGFIQYAQKSSAEKSIEQMTGIQIGNSKIRCAWGRSSQLKVPMAPFGYEYPMQYPCYQGAGYYGQSGGSTTYGNYGYNPSTMYSTPQTQMGYTYSSGYSGGYSQGNSNSNDTPEVDFTKPEDVEALNKIYSLQRGSQFIPPSPTTGYLPLACDPKKNTAMAGFV